MTYSLEGKVVFVTGAARGIGAETARIAARRGARLALVGMEPEKLAALATELGGRHTWAECDVTNQASLERAVEHAAATLGGIDVVVANAGIASAGTVSVTPVEALTRVIDVNLNGVVRTVATTLSYVTERRGYYLLVSSAAALRALPGMATYAASKSGVEQFGSALRLELAHKGVGVGVAHPSWIDTDLVRDAKHDISTFEQMLKRLPGPFGATTSVETCAEAFVEAMESRKNKLYVPRSLAFFSAIRPLLAGPLMDAVIRRDARTSVPQFEREVQSLGRAFGRQSVGFGEKAASSATNLHPQEARPARG